MAFKKERLLTYFNPLFCSLGIEAPQFKQCSPESLDEFCDNVVRVAKEHLFLPGELTIKPIWIEIAQSENKDLSDDALKEGILVAYLLSIRQVIAHTQHLLDDSTPHESVDKFNNVFCSIKTILSGNPSNRPISSLFLSGFAKQGNAGDSLDRCLSFFIMLLQYFQAFQQRVVEKAQTFFPMSLFQKNKSDQIELELPEILSARDGARPSHSI